MGSYHDDFDHVMLGRSRGMEQPMRRTTGTRADQTVRLAAAILVVGLMFCLHTRYVLVNFTRGAALADTGWFAWIMAAGDPWLTNPRAVSDLSYFNYHLTPYLSGITLIVHALGADRFVAYAVHQGTVFALLAAGLCALVLTTWRGWRSGILFLAAIFMILFGDATLQIAGFPHPEAAIVSFCTLAGVLWLNGHRRWAAVGWGLACLVREDGGLYSAAFLFALALLPPLDRRTFSSTEVKLGATTILVSLLMFWIKGQFFPGFSAFAFNYSGNHWDHLTPESLRQRFGEFVINPQALAAIIPALLLAVVSWRYLIFPVLMAPLILAQLLAARNHLWEFHYYYAMPFLVIWVGLMLVAADRSRKALMRSVEAVVLLLAAVCGSAPFLFTVDPDSSSLGVLVHTVRWPVENLVETSARIDAVTAAIPGVCVSSSVAAISPDSFSPERVLDPDIDINRCQTILLYTGGPLQPNLTWHLVYWVRGPLLEGHLQRYDKPDWWRG
jgi:hypothetical protein